MEGVPLPSAEFLHMTTSRTNGVNRAALTGLLALLLATALGGCFLFFPKKSNPTSGTSAQPGRIVGHFVDEAGRPVVGAGVIIPEAGQLTTLSDKDGAFVLAGLAPGTWYLRVTKEGYLAGSFGVNVEGAATVQFQGQLALAAGNLHKGGVPNLCGDCHVLHDPTPSSHLTIGASPNAPCFAAGCHAAGGAGPTINETTYRNSQHGPASTYNSNTQQAWTGQPASERGNCNTCHEPHGISGPPFMLKKGVRDGDGTLHLNDVCFECHANPGTGNTVKWPGKVAYQNAANLHVNAATVPPSTLRKYPGTTYAMGECVNCHLPHGRSGDQHMLRASAGALCLACHTDKLAGGGHGDNCVMCHDPHVVTKTGVTLNVKNPADGTSLITKPTENWRGGTWSATTYCTGCHTASPPAWLPATARNPYAATTRFWNQSSFQVWSGSLGRMVNNDQNLHNVHINKVEPGWADHYGGVTGDLNKTKCGQCHSVHQTSRTRNLSPTYFSSITGSYSGNWAGKNGCTVTGGCHGCAWCHYSPGSPASACYECDWHGYNAHPTINY